MHKIAPHFDWRDAFRYIEPFCGALGAAVNSTAMERDVDIILSDANWELINLFEQFHVDPHALEDLANSWSVDETTYYAIRAWDRVEGWREPGTHSSLQLAARTLYLNRRCFNGLYRVNREGCFNVPWNRNEKAPPIDVVGCHDVRKLLSRAKLRHADYDDILSQCRAGDIVYCDPPYVDASDPTKEFQGYVGAFGWSQQCALRDALLSAHDRGARVYVSNTLCDATRELYADFSVVTIPDVQRSISRRGSGRGRVEELLAFLH